MNRTLSALIPLIASLYISSFPANAQVAPATTVSGAECAAAAHPSNLQSRIVDKAAQGIIPLRQFVWGTRMIYQLDLMETVAWLDQRRALLAACEQRSAHVDPITAAPVSGPIQLH